jgi:hypothetical protein
VLGVLLEYRPRLRSIAAMIALTRADRAGYLLNVCASRLGVLGANVKMAWTRAMNIFTIFLVDVNRHIVWGGGPENVDPIWPFVPDYAYRLRRGAEVL